MCRLRKKEGCLRPSAFLSLSLSRHALVSSPPRFSFLPSTPAPFRLFTGPENPRGGTAYIKIKARPIKVAPNALSPPLPSGPTSTKPRTWLQPSVLRFLVAASRMGEFSRARKKGVAGAGAKGKLARYLARVFESTVLFRDRRYSRRREGGQGEKERERERKKCCSMPRNNNARPQKRSAAFLNLSGRRENRYTHEERREMRERWW